MILFGNLSCLGFHTTVIRFLPGYRMEDAHDKIMGLTSTARVFAMFSASALAIFGFVFLYFFGERIASYYLIPVSLALFTLPMVALGDVLNGTARANGWAVSALSPTYIVRPVLILLFMLVAIGFGAEKPRRRPCSRPFLPPMSPRFSISSSWTAGSTGISAAQPAGFISATG